MKKVEDYIITIPDHPIPGIMFRDITSVLSDADGFKLAIDEMDKKLQGVEFDAVAGMESRGFIFGTVLAYLHHKAFIPIRKAGKLPREVVSQSYELEYGEATIEMHKDDLKPGSRVVIVDDLIATGGTALAAAKLIETVGSNVAMFLFLLELKGLDGRAVLKDYPVEAIVSYDGK